MISQKFRFHGHASLNYVFKNGKQERSRFCAIKYLANPHRRHPRLAVVVSKKVFKSAAKRNRIRRRIYEIARPFLTEKSAAIDVVISVYSPEVFAISAQDLAMQILPLIHVAGLKP
jgi:ribonuclease P protein component